MTETPSDVPVENENILEIEPDNENNNLADDEDLAQTHTTLPSDNGGQNNWERVRDSFRLTIPLVNLLPLLVFIVFFITMARVFFDRAREALQGGEFYNSPLAAALIWPFVFAALEAIFNGIINGQSRDGAAKYVVEHKTSDRQWKEYPLQMEDLSSRLSMLSAKDLDVLPTGFWETSMAVNLCIAALSSNVVNIIFLLNTNTLNDASIEALQIAFFTLAAQFFVLATIAQMLKVNSSRKSIAMRIIVSQGSNLIGILILYLSFLLIAGRL